MVIIDFFFLGCIGSDDCISFSFQTFTFILIVTVYHIRLFLCTLSPLKLKQVCQ